MHIPYLSAWYGAWLSEAECKAGDVGRARERARQSLAAARASGFRWVEGLAQRTMGRAAHAGGAPEEARALIADAVEMFDGIGARYEAARARLQLAAVVRGCGDTDSADNHLREAQRGLKEIGVQRLEACVDATLPG
jgi:ATP/maltotriose-dependent transcriptional regulator MalT